MPDPDPATQLLHLRAIMVRLACEADYVKGYRGRRDIDDAPPVSRDWKLARPTKVTVLPRDGAVVATERLPLFG